MKTSNNFSKINLIENEDKFIQYHYLKSKRRTKNLVITTLISALMAFSANALAKTSSCPYAFQLRGSSVDNPWKKVTPSAWLNMLPEEWQDKGFHFYARIRNRGPTVGINTPDDLESEIMKGHTQRAEGKNRWQIVLPIVNDEGQHLAVIYDYSGKPKSKCQLVTVTYLQSPR